MDLAVNTPCVQGLLFTITHQSGVTDYVGIVLVDGRFNYSVHNADINKVCEAVTDKVCELYGPTAKLLDLQIAEIVHQLIEHREYHYEDCVIYIGDLTEIRNQVSQ